MKLQSATLREYANKAHAKSKEIEAAADRVSVENLL